MWNARKAKLDIATLDVERATPLVRSQTLTEREFDTRRSTQRDAAGAGRLARGGAEAGRAQSRMDARCARRSPAASPTGASMPAI